jgi:hypothetical protein
VAHFDQPKPEAQLTDDAYPRTLTQLESSRRTLVSHLTSLGETIRVAMERRLSGAPLSDIPEAISLIAQREAVLAALTAFNVAFAASRAEGIRLLVDEEGRTLASVARLMSLSRQVVSRIYNERVSRSK